MKVRRYRETHYVYRLFNEQGRALYVGCSISPVKRVRFHQSKPWGPEIFEWVITEHSQRQLALRVERYETWRLDPEYNVVNTPRNPQVMRSRAKKRAAKQTA